MNKLLGSIINKFDAEAKSHLERQSLNPFSGNFSRSPSPRLSKDQYGRPLAGSKTEERGQKAKCHILREIQDLCNCIHDLGVYNKTHKQNQDSDDEEENNDDEIIITFGEIFQMYTKINDKVVGLLIAAKKRGFIFFEKEILFQRRDDDVLIALIKPIHEIRDIINKELAAAKSPISFQSRDASPAVGDDSDTDKSTGNIPNGSSGGSSKSGSGSPVEKKIKGRPRSKTPNRGKVETAAVNKNESVAHSSTEVNKEEIDKVKKENNDIDPNVNLGNEEPAKSSSDETNTLPPVTVDNMNGNLNDKVEAKEVAVEVLPSTQNNEPVAECVIPSVEVTCEEESVKNEIAEMSSEQIAQSSTEQPIPTIEITKAATPERGSSEEPTTILTDEVNDKEPKNDETTSDKICDVSESAEVIVDKNVDHSKESVEVNVDESVDKSKASVENNVNIAVLPDEPEKVDVNISTDAIESTKIEDSVVQTINEPDAVEVPSAPVYDNERKRTFSNEELIESLAAALSGRSSSPDICDEEVEQIFQSHAAATPLLNDPTQEINMTQVTNTQGIMTTNVTDTSEQIMVTTPEIIKSKTPENTASEATITSAENTLTEVINEPIGEANSENSVSTTKTNENSLGTETQNLENDAISGTKVPSADHTPEIKVPTPDNTSEIEISTTPETNVPSSDHKSETEKPNTEINEFTSDSITQVKTPTPETSSDRNSMI